MSGRRDKAMRKVAKQMSDELIPTLANNTNEVIMQMQQTWPHEDKVQFCKWFLGVSTEEELLAEIEAERQQDDPAQGILFCDGNHAESTPCADPRCWHKGDEDGEEDETASNPGNTATEGSIH